MATAPADPGTGRLLLVDAASLYFRAFHGVPTTVQAPDGTPVNAVRGFLDGVASVLRSHPASGFVACLDADWRPAFRVAALPEYKAHRLTADGGEDVPAELVGQVPVIEEVLDAVGLARLGVPGYEADDVAATLAARADHPVDVLTGDRDLFQVVRDDAPVRVLYTGRGIRNLQVVDEAEVTARYGVPGRAYGSFAVLRGDPSDGLPGVPGVGDKSAAALVSRFGTLEAILAALDSGAEDGFPAGSRRRLQAARDYLERAPQVVLAPTDVPVPDDLDVTVPQSPRDPEALLALVDRWGLETSVNRLLAALAAQPSSEVP